MAKVLLVEDDNNLREIYEARLSAEAYTIITAQNGEEALVVAKKEHPDLIISDVMMPRISGFEMLDILRNTDELRDTKVIMLTALGQAEDQSRAGKLGADKYLVKSQVTLEDIVNTANELLGIIPAVSPTTAPDPSPASIPAPVATPVVTSGLDPVSTPPIAQPASNPPTTQQAPQQVTAPVTQPAIPDPISAAPAPVAAPTVVEPASAEPAPETPTPAVVQDSVPQANQVPVIADPVAIPEPTPIPEPVATAIPVPNQAEASADIPQTPDVTVPIDTPEIAQPPIVTVADPDPISAAPAPVAAPTVVEPASAEPAPETPTPAVVQDSVPQANQVPVIADPVAIPEPTPIPEPVATAIPVPNQAEASANITQTPDVTVPIDTPEIAQPPIVTVADPDPISAAPAPIAAPTVVEPVSAEPAPETPAPAVVQDSVPQANQVPVIADPVAIPEPTPITEPVATAIPVPNQADFEEAQTMAAEEATVESQIETFAANAPTQEASTAPALTQVADQAETANDQTLTEAVNDLTAATSVGPEPVLPPSQQQVPGEETPADQSAPTTFVAPPLEPTTPAPEPAPTDPSSPETQAVAGHKIIQPINTTTGPNLDELLAKEEAKELQQNGQQAAPIVNGTPAATNPGFDPNSIAL